MTQPQQVPKTPCLSCGRYWSPCMDCLLLFTSCLQLGLCSETPSAAAGLCDGLFVLFQGFLLPAHCSPSSCGPSQPPSACPSLCCVLRPRALWLGSVTQAGMSVLQLPSPAGSAVWCQGIASHRYSKCRAVISHMLITFFWGMPSPVGEVLKNFTDGSQGFSGFPT